MTKQNIDRILLIYNILLSTSIIVTGVCLISGCLNIYYSGNGYSREFVAQTFSKICIPVYICLGLIVGSFIINAIIPIQQRIKPTKYYNQMLNNLLNTEDTSNSVEFRNLKKNKTKIKAINLVVLVISCTAFLIYALNSKHFHQNDINGSMIKAMWRLVPCFFVPFAFSIFTYYYDIALTKKQIEFLQTLPKKEKASHTSKIKSDCKKVLITKIVIATFAVGILIFGAVTGGFADVLTKAINICTECIGLG